MNISDRLTDVRIIKQLGLKSSFVLIIFSLSRLKIAVIFKYGVKDNRAFNTFSSEYFKRKNF